MIEEIKEVIFGFRRPRFRFNTTPMPISDFPLPSLLSFSLADGRGDFFTPAVKEGDEVRPGQIVGKNGSAAALVSPVGGRVARVNNGPALRGTRPGPQVLIAPAPGFSTAVFASLDPLSAKVEELWKRMEAASVRTASLQPRALGEVIGPGAGEKVETLVILAADREPLQCSALQLFRERSDEACTAALMLGRMAGAKKTLVAVPRPAAGEARKVCERRRLEVLDVGNYYPESLEPLIALRLGNRGVRVVSVETALAALESVQAGKVQEKKVVTVIGPGGEVWGNYRIPLGTRLKDLFEGLKLHPGEGDKVIAGGPMRGMAQYSSEVSVDPGVDAVTLIRTAEIIPWSDEPCVNCGACVSVCPVRLQIGMLGRFAEFSKFDLAEQFSLMSCIECGLCAAVCTARRPLVQWLRMAKREVEKKRAALRAREEEKAAEASPESGAEPV